MRWLRAVDLSWRGGFDAGVEGGVFGVGVEVVGGGLADGIRGSVDRLGVLQKSLPEGLCLKISDRDGHSSRGCWASREVLRRLRCEQLPDASRQQGSRGPIVGEPAGRQTSNSRTHRVRFSAFLELRHVDQSRFHDGP